MVMLAAGLSRRAIQNIAIIRGGVAQGLTRQGIQGLIIQTGQRGMRKTDLLKGIRYAKGLQETGSYLRSVGLDRYPNPSRLAESISALPRRFRYEVRVRGIDTRTGLPATDYITVRSDEALTRREIEAEAKRKYELGQEERAERYALRDLTLQLESGAFRR